MTTNNTHNTDTPIHPQIDIKHYTHTTPFNDTYLFNIFYLNIRSIKNKLHEINAYIDKFKFIFDVIVGLTETWLHDFDGDFFNIMNYNAYHNTRKNREGGGYYWNILQYE